MTRFLLACCALLLCIGAVTRTTAAGPETGAALHATNYIRTLQVADGGFPDFAASSTPSATLDAVFAFSAAGIDPRTVRSGAMGPDDYLATQASSYSAASPGGAAKLVTGLATMDIDPTNFGSINALAAMEANYVPGTGKYGDDAFAQSLFILAERSLSRPVPPASATYLISLQQGDGGWEYCCGFGTDTNTTAIAMRALIAAGTPTTNPAIVAAIAYLHANQGADGGFPYSAGFDSDANSTSYVMQAIIALGQSAEAGGPWDLGVGKNPLAILLSFQNPTTGALTAFGSDSPFATYQGVPALMLDAFPEQGCVADADCDAVTNGTDNCVYLANAPQANGDSGPPPPAGNTGTIDNGSGVIANDTSIPNGDGFGDACDADRDNDGLPDTQDIEPLGATGMCAAFSGSSDAHPNPAFGDVTDTDGTGPSWDTDKDGVLDGVECQLGTNPRSAASNPSVAACGGIADADLDGLSAAAEKCKWGTSDTSVDSDGDGKKDCVEANDTNGDGVQNFPGDVINSAKASNGIIQKTIDFDLNGDSVVNFPGDTILSAKMASHVGGICM